MCVGWGGGSANGRVSMTRSARCSKGGAPKPAVPRDAHSRWRVRWPYRQGSSWSGRRSGARSLTRSNIAARGNGRARCVLKRRDAVGVPGVRPRLITTAPGKEAELRSGERVGDRLCQRRRNRRVSRRAAARSGALRLPAAVRARLDAEAPPSFVPGSVASSAASATAARTPVPAPYLADARVIGKRRERVREFALQLGSRPRRAPRARSRRDWQAPLRKRPRGRSRCSRGATSRRA